MKVAVAVLAGVLALGLVAGGLFLAARSGPEAPAGAQLDALADLSPERKNDVVPILRPLGRDNARPVQAIEAVPQDAIQGGLKGQPMAADDLPLMDFFVGNLSIRYAVDGEKMMRNVAPSMLGRLGTSREELRSIAVTNLHRRYPSARVSRQPGFSMVVEGGDLESSWMLDFAFWEKEAATMKGLLVASVPAREVMVWCDSADSETLKLIKQKGDEVYASEQASNRAVSPFLYAWKGGHWEVFSAP